MTSRDLTPDDQDQPEPVSPEVQFALVISRMIDSVKNSPADMRQVVYDLARYKLREQLTYSNTKDIRRTKQALEIAIRGVEDFSQQRADTSAATALPPTHNAPPRPELPAPQFQRSPSRLQIDPEPYVEVAKPSRSRWPHLGRTAAIIAIIVGISGAVQQRGRLQSVTHSLSNLQVKTATDDKSAPAQVIGNSASVTPPTKPAQLRPTDYGVYAIGDDALVELGLLPGRPMDIRVAVSATFKMPSRAILSNGHPRFIVFRRDAASNVPDRAEVRVIARIAREFSAEVIGKTPAEGDDTWVVRNVSFPFRTSPLNDNPEMYELHSEDPALELTPGRYALILKTQAYDFTVEGTPVDPKQCIERIVGSNGTFYSDCKKP